MNQGQKIYSFFSLSSSIICIDQSPMKNEKFRMQNFNGKTNVQKINENFKVLFFFSCFSSSLFSINKKDSLKLMDIGNQGGWDSKKFKKLHI